MSSFKSYSVPEMPLPLTPPSPAYSRRSSPGARVTLIVTPFISEAAKQVDKWAFAACRRTHRGVLALTWKWEGGGRLSLLSFGPQAVLHGYKNSEQQVLNGKVGLRAVQRSPAVMKVNRLACPLTEMS